MDSSYRSIAKAVSYRVLGSIATGLIFLVLSHDLKLSLGAGLIDALVKTAAYYLHERVWEKIPFGRQRRPEYEI